jgi:hypothetical protein
MKSVALALFLAVFSSVAMADNIAIQNSSFEDLTGNPLINSCGTGCAYNNGPINGWTSTGGQNGSQTLNSTYYSGPLPDGTVMAYSNGGTISQTLAVSLLPDSVYTLSVYIGNRLDDQVTNYSFSLLAGGTVLNTFSGSNGSITPGTFQQEFLTFTTGDVVAPGLLGIQLASAGQQTDFDDVQLSDSPSDPPSDGPVGTPEPSSLLMLGMGLLGVLGVAGRKQVQA